MVSKKIIAALIVFAVVLSIAVTGLAISKALRNDNANGAETDGKNVGEGKVSFYVKEKLEPKTGNTTVKFRVVKK